MHRSAIEPRRDGEGERGGGAREGERESAYCASMRWLMATNHQVGTVEVMGEKAGRA